MLSGQAVDVVVLNPALNGDRGRELIRIAKSTGAAVLLYRDESGPADAATGFDGIAAREGTPAEFLTAVRAVARGESHIDPRVANAAEPAPPRERRSLTAREREVVQLLATGLTGEEIAGQLFLSSETVRTHIRNAMQRMDAHTRAHLIALAVRDGEVTVDEARPAETA